MPNNAFFKFFQDLVLSETWKKLTPSARTLYPVLAIHTDKDFKPVYPSLKRLKALSGLGNSGIASALRSLEENGLVRIWSGKHKSGNVPNTYEFTFEYAGCQISLPPLQGKATPAVGLGHAPAQGKATPNAGQTLAPQEEELAPQKATNKKNKKTRTKRTRTSTTNTTIQGDVHINIDHGPKPAVVESLKQFFSESLARQLAQEHPPEYIQEKIEITRYNQERGKVRDPAAYLRQAISQDYGRPTGFTTSAEREQARAQDHQFQELKERIQKGQVTIARHRTTGQTNLVDVPADLAYVILQSRRGTRCINSWDDAQQYHFQ
ncbi:MAG: helix-turn-helix domain-containing protein [Candidatus Brocadiia bacterium]